jgi:hypothetical protein
VRRRVAQQASGQYHSRTKLVRFCVASHHFCISIRRTLPHAMLTHDEVQNHFQLNFLTLNASRRRFGQAKAWGRFPRQDVSVAE